MADPFETVEVGGNVEAQPPLIPELANDADGDTPTQSALLDFSFGGGHVADAGESDAPEEVRGGDIGQDSCTPDQQPINTDYHFDENVVSNQHLETNKEDDYDIQEPYEDDVVRVSSQESDDDNADYKINDDEKNFGEAQSSQLEEVPYSDGNSAKHSVTNGGVTCALDADLLGMADDEKAVREEEFVSGSDGLVDVEDVKITPQEVESLNSAADPFGTSEATPPPSPPPATAAPEAGHGQFGRMSSPLADTTTSTDNDGPVKMPKATTISPPTKAIRTGNSSGCVASCLRQLDPKVVDVITWREPRVTGPILAAILISLITLARCSIFSVVSYLLLIALVLTFTLRVVKTVVAKVHTGNDSHPLKDILEADIVLSEEAVADFAQTFVQRFNPFISTLRDWTLVKDYVTSLKFGCVLYALTFFGAWFNGLTVVIIVTVAAFTLPKVYEVNKSQIDQYVDIAQAKFDDLYKQLEEKVPYLKKQKTQ